MRKTLFGVLGFLLAIPVFMSMRAQSAATPEGGGTATVITAAEMKALAEKQPATTPVSDQLVRVVDVNKGEYNVGIAIIHRAKVAASALPSALEHSQIAEVYYILSGKATDVTGGKMENPTAGGAPTGPGAGSTIGPTFSDRTTVGGVSHDLGPGDVSVIPPNTPHYFSEIKSDELMYVVDRIDPHHVLAMPGQMPHQTTGELGAPGAGVDIGSAEINAAAAQTGTGIVQVLRVVGNNAGEYNLAIAVLHRTPEGNPTLEDNNST